MSTFEAYPKTPRWNREVVITEKIDGTNSAIIIDTEADQYETWVSGNDVPPALAVVEGSDEVGQIYVYAQSRNRLIFPGKTTDNYGFAAWVQENAEELVKLLGPGRHFGEWYGKGIARGYGLDHKRFALFNVKRWGSVELMGADISPYQLHNTLPVDVVPVLQRGFTPNEPTYRGGPSVVEEVAAILREHGSYLVPGFMRPEGVVLFHTASGQVYKILLEGDETPKGRAA